MAVVSMKKLLEAGVHFGHQTRRWNPKMKKYIYSARNDIHIIDLQQTVLLAEQAYDFVREIAKEGKSVLFVGTKKQAQAAIESEATRCGMYYINNRWLGGTLTNHKTIRTRIERLNHINQMEAMGEFALLPKKEVAALKSERDKLQANLGGIKDMKSMPGCLFIVDCKKEAIAIAEAHILGIPIVAIVDTNCDPDDVTCIIPGNDDAIGAIKIIASVIANAVIEAREGIVFQVEEEEEREERVVTQTTAQEKEVKEQVPVKEMKEETKEQVPAKEQEAKAEPPIKEKKQEVKEQAPVKEKEQVPAKEQEAKAEPPIKEKKQEAKAQAPVKEEKKEIKEEAADEQKEPQTEAPAQE